MTWLVLTCGLLVAVLVGLLSWRRLDIAAERRVWNDLLGRAATDGATFDPSILDGLPEPAQRYLRYAIAPGTPLHSVVELEMTGQIGLGTRQRPRYVTMHARQILAPPDGFVWRLRAGRLSGSDGATSDLSWTRFWFCSLLPIVRVSGNPDHYRSAVGRVVSEGALWVPASLLPGRAVSWTQVDPDTARATVSCGSRSQTLDLTVEADGRPSRVVVQRWSNENPERVFRQQPFGGYLSEFKEVDGYRLPMCVEGGNLIGTADYFPSYRARVLAIRFPGASVGAGADS